MLRDFVKRYEAFLLIKSTDKAGVLIRSRTLYGIGWLFVFIQLLNFIGMSATYNTWTMDHTIAVVSCLIVIGAIHCLRFYKHFHAYALLLTLLCIAGVLASALPDHTGINSALLPLLILMPVLNGFISGPRAALFTGVCALILIGALYFCSTTHIQVISPFYDSRTVQRALQAVFATIMVTGVAAVVSANIFRAFSLLEANIERARKAEAAKEEFLASMSHELRTPLNGVLGLTSSLLNTSLDKEQIRLMTAIETSGRSLLVILNDILDLSKIEAGKLETIPEAFDPRTLLIEIADTWRETANAKGLKVVATVDDAIPSLLLGDDLRARQIVSNLVSNAIKFTDNGCVNLAMTIHDETDEVVILKITVHDTGIGIQQEALDKIFAPFEQAESGIARKYGGTGLGLSICRRLTTLMGGDIEVQSVEGQGSTFSLTLPMERLIEASHTIEVEPSKSTVPTGEVDLKRTHVLLVEDNKINQLVMQQFLRTLGVEITLAENGQECLNILETETFDLILMDKHMPVMDGMEATAVIRAMSGPVADIPIIACTADAMNGEQDALIGAGFTDYLPKPVNQQALEIALRKAAGARMDAIAAA